MRFALKKRPVEPPGPRKNQWKDPQGESAAQQVNRVKRARRRAFARRVAWLTGATFLVCLITGAVKYSGPMLQHVLEIQTITVEGVHHIDKQKVIELAQIKPGMPLHHIITTTLEERIESHPWVKQAEVSRVLFHELRISVIERKPAVVVRAESQNFLSDEEGHLLTRLGQADDDAFPLVTGVELQGFLQGADSVRRSIISGIELARVIGQTIEGRLQVHAENPTNLVAFIQGIRFQFGQEALGEQWKRFQRVKPTLKPLNFDGEGRGVSEVDLRYDNRIIVREGGG
jgi:cell division protein FtsQ